jgi:hypothetical protein
LVTPQEHPTSGLASELSGLKSDGKPLGNTRTPHLRGKKQYQSVGELKMAIVAAWQSVEQEVIDNLVLSMDKFSK